MDNDERNVAEEKQELPDSPGLMAVVEALLKRPGELVDGVRRDGRDGSP